MSGQYLSSDFSLPCPPGLDIPEEQRYTITANTLKVSLPVGWEPCMPQDELEEQDPARDSVPLCWAVGRALRGLRAVILKGFPSADPPAPGMLCCVLDFLLHAGGLPDKERGGAGPGLLQPQQLQVVPAGQEAPSPGERPGDGVGAAVPGERHGGGRDGV